MTTTKVKPEPEIKHELNALTSCDKHPSARAYTVAYKDDLKLFWCKHCSDKYNPHLFGAGWNIDDQTSILTGEIEAFNSKSSDSDF